MYLLIVLNLLILLFMVMIMIDFQRNRVMNLLLILDCFIDLNDLLGNLCMLRYKRI
jgi:hypothetical protein